ncbi:saccharopine dehydrogenase [Hazenella sp. IB182357]|uniref:Saccharopine dehydrogenase n=1 Tax=Polycladospora coralii TaxID=2771432 RepID=A0A926N6L5_9BACL|nr:saccharopine dehydrogenase [Polycladospora coralii]MBD1373204.1 saccharopine dehydrogenase [Polycladospora coralii]
MKEHILVVGGYGHVGQQICRKLGNIYPGKVIAAGRSSNKAVEFCDTTNGTVIPLELDITKPLPTDLFDTIKLVVMCLDQKDTNFVRACFSNQVYYIDISADYSFLREIESLEAVVDNHGAAAVLSVGLAPGLTNLLASHVKSYLDYTEEIDIYVMLGLGDQHGTAAIEWTIDNVNKKFHIYSNREMMKVEALSDGKKTYFGKEIGKRTGYRFNFSDQHSLSRTLQVPTVSTRICFDSSFNMNIFLLLKRIGIFHFIKYRFFRKIMVGLFSKIRSGKEIYALKLDVFGKIGGKKVIAECDIHGRKEASITATIAARVCEKLYTAKGLKGVYHLEELFDISSFYPDITAPKVRITEVSKRN